ncbi:MAG: OmpP1/FadL family transporter [Beijerinckiaceae bacterium]|jgi:long-chain fatty acid transport protein|nr:OmpP1/FadL family transporter [Beijerinckiaceae bacterium]
MKGMFRLALAASASLISMQAMAGGFVNSSQSSVFNGMAYAGAAAPGSTSAATMFMNPATMTGLPGLTIDSNYTFGLPSIKQSGTTNLGALGRATSANYGMNYFVPATYIVYQVTPKLWAGLSINSTYGNSTKPDRVWVGSFAASTTRLRVITATPSVAYKINEMFSIGAGLQVQFADVRQTVQLPPLGVAGAGISKADGWSVGFTVGATFTPWKGTQIGLGWRSLTDQEVSGNSYFGPIVNNSNGKLHLPNRVNLSLRQTVTEQLDILASVEWQNWARIGNSRLNNPPNPALAVLPFGYRDGWFFSLGAEYKATQALTLRTGIGYEISPVTDAVRRVSLPDSDRLWLSTGFSYKATERFTINGSYTYLHFAKANIRQPLAPGLVYTGQSRQNAHLLSIGLTSRWGGGPAKEEPLVRKF